MHHDKLVSMINKKMERNGVNFLTKSRYDLRVNQFIIYQFSNNKWIDSEVVFAFNLIYNTFDSDL